MFQSSPSRLPTIWKTCWLKWEWRTCSVLLQTWVASQREETGSVRGQGRELYCILLHSFFPSISSTCYLTLPLFFPMKVVHKATLDVDEVGATATGATGVGIMLMSFRHIPVLKFNRPFMLVITDRATENTLFVGKIINPNIWWRWNILCSLKHCCCIICKTKTHKIFNLCLSLMTFLNECLFLDSFWMRKIQGHEIIHWYLHCYSANTMNSETIVYFEFIFFSLKVQCVRFRWEGSISRKEI